MLRWMKKGNDVLLLQGKQKPGDREGGRERRAAGGGSASFVLEPVRPPALLIQVQIAPWGKCRHAQYSAAVAAPNT